jgi:hypothetical protein
MSNSSGPQINPLWIWIGGGFLALFAAVLLAMMINGKNKVDAPKDAGPTLNINIADPKPLDAKKTLRCFVSGQFVGQLTLKECAEKNGVAAQSLDVGLDESGNLAAAPTASLTPPPATPVADVKPQTTPNSNEVQDDATEQVPDIKPSSGPMAVCMRYSGNQWNRLSESVTLPQCLSILYDGRCEKPGSAAYGRWDGKTLRLVPKRIEISDDNVNFKTHARHAC